MRNFHGKNYADKPRQIVICFRHRTKEDKTIVIVLALIKYCLILANIINNKLYLGVTTPCIINLLDLSLGFKLTAVCLCLRLFLLLGFLAKPRKGSF